MIKNIIFDIGNVLVTFAWKESMINLGFDDKCIETLDKGFINDPLWDELDLGIKPESEVINTAIARFPQYEKEINLFWDKNINTIIPRDYSVEWMKALKRDGYKIYLLTNYPDSLFKKSVESAFPFYPYVDGEVVSSRVKIRKPDKEIYETLFKKYGLKPEESVFFDDRIVNIEGAEKVGLNAFLFTTYEQAKTDLKSLIDNGV